MTPEQINLIKEMIEEASGVDGDNVALIEFFTASKQEQNIKLKEFANKKITECDRSLARITNSTAKLNQRKIDYNKIIDLQ